MPRFAPKFAAICLVLSCLLAAHAQDLEDEFPPGLLAAYTAGDSSCERIDDDISFVWNDQTPDSRILPGHFSATWTGLQLIRQNATYRYHVYLCGEAELFIDGESALKASSDKPQWVSSEDLELRFGEIEFELKYTKTSPQACLKLYWSADAFPLEPVSRQLFFREEAHPVSKQYDEGRRLFLSRRCDQCHVTGQNLPTLAAPSLESIDNSLSSDWIVGKLTDPEKFAPDGKMPRFGFDRDAAVAISAFLLDAAQSPKFAKLPKSKDKKQDLAEGEKLFHSRGCLACHQMHEIGNNDAYAGTALDQIGAKRSPDWLFTWLDKPASLNRDHRMPTIELNKDERRQMAVYLSSLGKPTADKLKSNNELIARGKQLVKEARCANCHRIPGMESNRNGYAGLRQLKMNAGCLEREPAISAPSYFSQHLDRDALTAFVKQNQQEAVAKRGAPETDLNEQDRGELLLETRNCIQCHERGGSKGIVPVAGKISQTLESLRGESEAMIPPALVAIGDKLQDKALLEAVSGKQPRRMDWLHVRMPKFAHQEGEAEAIANALIAHDRIPDGAPDPHLFDVPLTGSTDPETLLLSNTLVGPKGFSCVACHQVGSFVPRNVALGTRGSDLLNMSKRMRSSYFVRWTRSPIRIVPGMEMPSIGHKPVPGILDADIDRQLATIWKGINDKNFTVPTNPASVEQFWTLKTGEPARVVRDVFTLPEAAGGDYLPRAMAVGFGNGHSLLFDLDRFELRQWTFGDFARQRTQGKSWYWDMAGTPIVSLKSGTTGFSLRMNGKTLSPANDNSQLGTLIEYRAHEDGLALKYRLNFTGEGQTLSAVVQEIWSEVNGAHPGWKRTFSIRELPPNSQLFLQAVRSAENNELFSLEQSAEKSPQTSTVEVTDGLEVAYRANISIPDLPVKPVPILINEKTAITSVPGFDGIRLPLPGNIMPTGMNWDQQGKLIFTSLKGHLFRATDTDGDGVEETLTVIEEGLASPYGVIPDGDSLLVAHKPEVLRLTDTNGDGRADKRDLFASGWGYTDNYHDWTCGFAKDSEGNLYVGLGSDYAQSKRPLERSRWRGSVAKISPEGKVSPFSYGFRYPTGLAFDTKGHLFATDNQGVQNTYNELNHLRDGLHFGVPARHETDRDAKAHPPAIQIPHPWSRSINGIAFIPEDLPALAPFAGHGIGCEYDSRFLIRFTLQEVAGVMQGATYYFSKPIEQAVPENFVGPLSIAISTAGEIFIGSIHDSGWLGGRNTGAIARLTPNKNLPNGIRELTATKDGFRLEFFEPIDRTAAAQIENYLVSGYTRKWSGSYATDDSERHRAEIEAVAISDDGRIVELAIPTRREGFVYEVSCDKLSANEQTLWPSTGHYTLHKIPAE